MYVFNFFFFIIVAVVNKSSPCILFSFSSLYLTDNWKYNIFFLMFDFNHKISYRFAQLVWSIDDMSRKLLLLLLFTIFVLFCFNFIFLQSTILITQFHITSAAFQHHRRTRSVNEKVIKLIVFISSFYFCV